MKFRLGHIVATPGALRTLEERGVSAWSLLRRHQSGDWGVVCLSDRHANEDALRLGERLFSAYVVGGDADKLWIITEADRSVTTILKPNEY